MRESSIESKFRDEVKKRSAVRRISLYPRAMLEYQTEL